MKYSTFTILFLNKTKLLSCCKTDSIPHPVWLLFVRITNTDGVFFYERNKCLALIKTTLFLAAGSLSKCASKHLYVLHFLSTWAGLSHIYKHAPLLPATSTSPKL